MSRKRQQLLEIDTSFHFKLLAVVCRRKIMSWYICSQSARGGWPHGKDQGSVMANRAKADGPKKIKKSKVTKAKKTGAKPKDDAIDDDASNKPAEMVVTEERRESSSSRTAKTEEVKEVAGEGILVDEEMFMHLLARVKKLEEQVEGLKSKKSVNSKKTGLCRNPSGTTEGAARCSQCGKAKINNAQQWYLNQQGRAYGAKCKQCRKAAAKGRKAAMSNRKRAAAQEASNAAAPPASDVE